MTSARLTLMVPAQNMPVGELTSEQIVLSLGAALRGIGVPAGGSTGQVLAKASDDDMDAEWVDHGGSGAPYAEAISPLLLMGA